jgi:nucleoside diphosphate kinase
MALSGNQTASGTKTFSGTVASPSFQMTGSCNIGNLASNTSQFVMCYNGNFMYRGPFIATALQVDALLKGFAQIMGATPAQEAQLQTLLDTNGLSAAALAATP